LLLLTRFSWGEPQATGGVYLFLAIMRGFFIRILGSGKVWLTISRIIMIKKLETNALPTSFYTRKDVVLIGKELLGKYLYTLVDGEICGGMIVETEAYCGATDKACHAHLNKHTKRTEIMYAKGGVAYVYLCYGIHSMFNIVTNEKDWADAILIRAISAETGVETMLERRKMDVLKYNVTAGPGCLTKALAIDKTMNSCKLNGPQIWVCNQSVSTGEPSIVLKDADIVCSPRVGIDYAGDDALLPWRFRILGNLWVSRAK